MPPISLVERFDAIAAPMFQQREVLAAESRTLADLRDALLPRLLSGELRLAPIAAQSSSSDASSPGRMDARSSSTSSP